MRFVIAKEHKDFFDKNGFIEFQDLIPRHQLKELGDSIDSTLMEKMECSPLQLSVKRPNELFLEGRDLWRGNELLKKFVLQQQIPSIIAALIGQKVLRIGCDQFLPVYPPIKEFVVGPNVYLKLLQTKESLENLFCIKGIIGGALISLKDAKTSEEFDDDFSSPIFSKHPGRVVIVRPDLQIDWSDLTRCYGSRYYLIVYASSSATYDMQPNDPHVNSYKKMDYIFNQKFDDRWHPIVFRRS